jgi:aspartate/tyrosine/aromatic aminotransferase
LERKKEKKVEIGIGIGFLTFVILVCGFSVFATASDAKKYKEKLRRYIRNYFSTEWKNGEEVCSAILWNQNDTITKNSLIAEVEKMVEEGLLEFRPRHGSTGLMGEYRLVQTTSSS